MAGHYKAIVYFYTVCFLTVLSQNIAAADSYNSDLYINNSRFYPIKNNAGNETETISGINDDKATRFQVEKSIFEEYLKAIEELDIEKLEDLFDNQKIYSDCLYHNIIDSVDELQRGNRLLEQGKTLMIKFTEENKQSFPKAKFKNRACKKEQAVNNILALLLKNCKDQ